MDTNSTARRSVDQAGGKLPYSTTRRSVDQTRGKIQQYTGSTALEDPRIKQMLRCLYTHTHTRMHRKSRPTYIHTAMPRQRVSPRESTTGYGKKANLKDGRRVANDPRIRSYSEINVCVAKRRPDEAGCSLGRLLPLDVRGCPGTALLRRESPSKGIRSDL